MLSVLLRLLISEVGGEQTCYCTVQYRVRPGSTGANRMWDGCTRFCIFTSLACRLLFHGCSAFHQSTCRHVGILLQSSSNQEQSVMEGASAERREWGLSLALASCWLRQCACGLSCGLAHCTCRQPQLGGRTRPPYQNIYDIPPTIADLVGEVIRQSAGQMATQTLLTKTLSQSRHHDAC